MNLNFGKSLILRRESSKVLKILWIVVICVSVWGLGYYVSENYIKLRIDPEILVKAKYVNSRTIPFPAVTICPPNMINVNILNLTKFFEDLYYNKTVKTKDLEISTAASQVCAKIYIGMVYFFKKNQHDAENIMKIFDNFSPQLEDVFDSCIISTDIDCRKVLIRSVTFLGNCYTFNMLGYHSLFNTNISVDFDRYKRKNITKSWNPKAKPEYHDDENDIKPSNWSIFDGYSSDDDWIQPLRAAGLQFFQLQTKIKNDEFENSCPNNYQSYRVILHSPDEIPTFSNVFTTLSAGDFKYMRMNAHIHKLDESLKKYPPDFRKCYFKDENHLKFLKSYTKLNCELECMTNFTYKSCGCVAFWMPRTNDMEVCKFKEIERYTNIYYRWTTSYYADEENKKKFPEFPCNCYPTCKTIKYTIINDFSMRHEQDRSNFTLSNFQIAFGESQILESRNYVTYKVQNFVSDIGGLAGLFLGFSLLSLFEMLLQVFAILRHFAKIISLKVDKIKQQKQNIQRHKIQETQERRFRFEHTIMMPEMYFGEYVDSK